MYRAHRMYREVYTLVPTPVQAMKQTALILNNSDHSAERLYKKVYRNVYTTNSF